MATETTTTASETTTTTTSAPFTHEERLSAADAVIRRNVLWAFGAGVLPLPLFDLLASTAVQIKMIKELSNLYGVTFREDIVKKLLASLLSGVAGVGAGTVVAVSFSKLIPGVGSAIGAALAPVTVGAITYATGNVFVMHFEAGGTLLDFDARAMRAHFKREFDGAKDAVSKLFEEEKHKTPKRV
ncbi:YcjF family protein [Nannocystis radixulma]|uniref:DUF697 domain-containing protein n=1 Tax=Nannocystis radixulma TaxID=2995305 RepID=A0ABT5B1M5_9BACT|nr:DUF697 domain-containing protein [Nannocystis radixulma]MDC0667991.1 DUF697 domain-containing protein [Nannocystis radixulma]